jgi:hypothetical protein
VKAKIILMVGVVAAVFSISPTVSRAAFTAAPEAQLVLSPTEGPPGTIFELTGSGFPPLSMGMVTFHGIDLGGISSDEDGNIRGFFMVPDVRSGPARVRVIVGRTRAASSFDVLSSGA